MSTINYSLHRAHPPMHGMSKPIAEMPPYNEARDVDVGAQVDLRVPEASTLAITPSSRITLALCAAGQAPDIEAAGVTLEANKHAHLYLKPGNYVFVTALCV